MQMSKVCRKCGRNLSLSEFSRKNDRPNKLDRYSSYCKLCMRIYSREWHQKIRVNREKIHKRKRAYREGGNREDYLRKQREYRVNIRLKALNHISINGIPECSVCGFKEDIRFLQIDHINDDGYIERGGRGHTCDRTYFKILRMIPQKAREKYQILCVLHNYAKKYRITGKDFKVVRIYSQSPII